jgi:hypothetical protein
MEDKFALTASLRNKMGNISNERLTSNQDPLAHLTYPSFFKAKLEEAFEEISTK